MSQLPYISFFVGPAIIIFFAFGIICQQVVQVINKRPGLTKCSFIAHSVGGLVARYAIGRLYRPSGEPTGDPSKGNSTDCDNTGGTIYGLEAVNFITVATPHLGSRGNKQVIVFSWPT